MARIKIRKMEVEKSSRMLSVSEERKHESQKSSSLESMKEIMEGENPVRRINLMLKFEDNET